MKVRSLLLSVAVITALASCSQNYTPPDPADDSNAPAVKVFLKLVEGDAVGPAKNPAVRAAVDEPRIATVEESKINDLTVFFFNSRDNLVGTPAYTSIGTMRVFETSTNAVKIAVIANLGSNQIGPGKLFAGVNTLAKLKEVDFSSVSDGEGGKKLVNQAADKLLSSGIGPIIMDNDTKQGSAKIGMHFMVANINSLTVNYKVHGTNGNKYWSGTKEGFLKVGESFKDRYDSRWKRFTITRIFLMSAQTKSPAYLDPSSYGEEFSLIPNPQQYAFANGVSTYADGTTAPFQWTDMPTVQTDGYLLNGPFPLVGEEPPTVPGTATLGNVLKKPWYVFQNPEASGHKTAIVLEVLYKTKVSPGTGDPPAEDFKYEYLAMFFGEKDAEGNPTTPFLEAGKKYDITINVNGDYQKGNSGGTPQGENPEEANTQTTITVEIGTASWDGDPDTISEEFGE